MAMRQADIDDVPPPPYSETDIYSTAGRTQNTNTSNSPRVPSSDDSASRVSSHASSSRSEVIFTPPLTPRTSGNVAPSQPHHHQHHRNDSLSATSLSNHPSSSVASDFAAVYFESRPPPPTAPPREQLVHIITVNPSTTPDNVPYAPAWAARDVTQQDWATFTNVLIPHHAVARNDAIIDRKLQAEEDAVAASSNGRGASSVGSTHAAAQLDQIRSDPETDPGAAAAGGGPKREDVEAVVAQWNEGFFRPRRMLVALTPEVEELRMPGGWDQSFDRNIESPSGPTPLPFSMHPQAQGLVPPPQQQQQQQQPGSRSWNFAGIRLSEDGISIGDRIVADINGIRVGNFIADERGIRFGSGNSPRSQPQYPGQPWGPGPQYGPGIGPPPGTFSPVPHVQPGHPEHHHFPGPHAQPPYAAEHPHFAGGRGGSGGRGRHLGRHPSDRRSPSSSSGSSDSSTSSNSTTSSIGSLPDYEELYPAQLPLYKQRVMSWLSHPNQPVTRTDVAQLRSDVQSVRSQSQAGRANDPDIDEKALKAEIKALTGEWRKLKRQQRTLRKEKRRERRLKRREEKRERREQRRESKRERRESRRGGGGNHHQHQHHNHHHHHPHQTPGPWNAPPGFIQPPPVQIPAIPIMHPPPAPNVTIPSPMMHTPPPPPPPPPTQPPNVNLPNGFPWGDPSGAPGRGFGQVFPGPGPWSGGFGRGWGGGRGRGGNEPFTGGFPGAWPVGGERGAETPASPATPSSQTLFRAVQDMEKDLEQKVEELDKVRFQQREEEIANSRGRGRCGGGRGRGRGWGGRGRDANSSSEQKAQRLEEEIDTMTRNVEKLRVEADAEFARELQAEDRNASGGW